MCVGLTSKPSCSSIISKLIIDYIMIDFSKEFGIVFDKVDTSYCAGAISGLIEEAGEVIEECKVLFNESSKQFVTESGEKLAVHGIYMSKRMDFFFIHLRTANYDFEGWADFSDNNKAHNIQPFLSQHGIRVRDLDFKKRRSRKGAAS